MKLKRKLSPQNLGNDFQSFGQAFDASCIIVGNVISLVLKPFSHIKDRI